MSVALGPFAKQWRPAPQVGGGVGLPFGGLLTSCVGLWKASSWDSGNSRLTDLSGLGNHLVSPGGALTPKYLPYAGSRYVWLPGVAGNYLSAPDSAALSITGDIEFDVEMTLDAYASTEQALGAKWSTGALAYMFTVTATGALKVWASSTGAAATTQLTSSATLPSVGIVDGQRVRVVATLDVNNGAVGHTATFYYSTDLTNFTELGTAQVGAGITSIADTTAVLELGSSTGGTGNLVAGVLHRVKVRNGIAGTVVFDAQPGELASGTATTFVEDSANTATVTLNRSATGAKAVVVDRTVLMFGNDYLQLVDNDLFDFGASDSFTVAVGFRVYGGATSGVYLAKRNGITAADAGWSIHLNGLTRPILGIADGAAAVADSTQISPIVGALTTVVGVRDTAADTVEAFQNEASAAATADTTTGSLANTLPVRLGRLSGASASYMDFEFIGAAVWRRALTAAERTQVDVLLGSDA